MKFKRTPALFLVSLLTLLSACSFSFFPSEDVPVTGVSLTMHNIEKTLDNKTYKFNYNIIPDNATNKKVTWTTSDSSIGTIDSKGVFTAVDYGEVDVTVTTDDGGYTDTCEVHVVEQPTKVIGGITAECRVSQYHYYDQVDKNDITIYAVYTNPIYPSELIECDFELEYDFSKIGRTWITVIASIDGNQFTTLINVEVIDGGNPDLLTINITAFNDFHGAIEPDTQRMGLAKVGTYLKKQSEKENTLTLSQGDDWQGSIYSNFNRGRLVNDVFAYAHLSARTIGNHDFDWGVDALKENTRTGYDNYVTPVLAANVYDYNFSTKTQGSVQQSDIGVPTVTYTLENGIKVGIVGTIGEDQITTITSSYTEDICFKNHITSIKQYATELRNDGCDVVIATCHSGQEDLLGNGLEDYVDLVLCGHSHQNEYTVENGLHYYQFACYGEYLGQITLNFNSSTKEVTFGSINYINIYNINDYVQVVDSTIVGLIDDYYAECNLEANEILATGVSGTFYKGSEAANLMCKAIYERAVSEGHDDVLLSYCNTARSHIYSGKWTYADIYQAFPFDNVVYIETVKGSDILDEVKEWNNVYINPAYTGTISINRNQYYKIAVLDYLLYHTNKYRYYDYFSSFDGVAETELSMNYRHILREWLRNHKSTALNSSDYSSHNESFDRSRLE